MPAIKLMSEVLIMLLKIYFHVGKDLIQMRMELGWSCLLTNMANL